jgi:hypothetical protein
LRQWLFEGRKRVLANLLGRQRDGISFNDKLLDGGDFDAATDGAQPTDNSFQPHQSYLNSGHRTYRPIPHATEPGTFHEDPGSSGRTGKFLVLRVSFYALRRDN